MIKTAINTITNEFMMCLWLLWMGSLRVFLLIMNMKINPDSN